MRSEVAINVASAVAIGAGLATALWFYRREPIWRKRDSTPAGRVESVVNKLLGWI